MPALRLLNALAGRGLSLSLEGTRLRVAPAGLLTDEDRHLIRQFRDDLFALLSERARTRPSEPVLCRPEPPAVESVEAAEPMEAAGRTRASMVLHHRPDSLARWPIPTANDGASWPTSWRRRGELAGGGAACLRDSRGREGSRWQERGLRVHRGASHSRPVPGVERAIDPRDYLPKPTPPRPLGSPPGESRSRSVSWNLPRGPRAGRPKTPYQGHSRGMEQWFLVELRDLPRMKEGIAAEEGESLRLGSDRE